MSQWNTSLLKLSKDVERASRELRVFTTANEATIAFKAACVLPKVHYIPTIRKNSACALLRNTEYLMRTGLSS